VVSIVELVGGMRTVERREVWRLLASFRVQPATEMVARRAGEMLRRYRRSHNRIGLGDYLIAATADVHGLELATLNVRHFPMFEHLQPPFAITREQRPKP
jgi:predicted nucleic acid-binding protein